MATKLSKQVLAQLIEQLEYVKKFRKMDTMFTNVGPYPREAYPKQLEFFEKGRTNHLRLMMAGNRVGKTLAAAYEITLHMTGLYPEWWEGRRFTTCSQWWVCGVDSRTILTVLQPMLLGQVGNFGSGMIPKECLDFSTLRDAKKADTAINHIRVKHINGTYSSLEYKSYESGREAFQGAAVSVWLDEEPPLSVFTECLMRTATGNNCLMMTFTPLKGISDTILSFFDGGDFHAGQVGDSKWVTMAGWDDVPHLDAETKKILIAATPPYQRDARTKGVPQLGSGAIFPVSEADVVVEPFEIPKHWPRAYGLDVGRNTAAVWIAFDRESQVIYTYSDYFCTEGLPSTHTASIKARGDWVRGAIDTAARGRSQTDGENLFQIYTELGLKIQNADKAVESGLLEMLELMVQGRLKIFSTCRKLLEEFRMYRRDDKGQIVKKNDHCCFTGDTIIHHEEFGEIEIEKLVGTTGRVLSRNGYTDYTWAGLVDSGAEVIDVTFSNGEVITCTPDHRFLTVGNEWVEARVLVGCEVKTATDSLVALHIESRTNREKVFCLTVPETSCFAVGESKIIGHNCDAWRYAVFTRDRILRNEAEAIAASKPVDLEPGYDYYHKDSWMLS